MIRLTEFVKEKIDSFNSDTLTFLSSTIGDLSDMQNVAIKFKNELKKLLNAIPVDEARLQRRINAAIYYFSDILQSIARELKKSPAITDSKLNAMKYNDDLEKVFCSIEERLHIFEWIKDEFSVEQYFSARSTFVMPPFTVDAFAGTSQSNKTSAKYPVLYYKLIDHRKNLCEQNDIPLYSTVSTQALTEMATFLPQSKSELLQISGFTMTTVAKYGQEFLDIIKAYCDEHDLESMMHEKVDKKKTRSTNGRRSTKTAKSQKGDSQKITLDLYKQGLSIAEIARKRGYADSTIKIHLAHYVRQKELPINDFVTPELQAEILELLKTKTAFSDIYRALKGRVDYTEIGMVASLLPDEDSKK
jgi:uncharacterized protein YpbB